MGDGVGGDIIKGDIESDEAEKFADCEEDVGDFAEDFGIEEGAASGGERLRTHHSDCENVIISVGST